MYDTLFCNGINKITGEISMSVSEAKKFANALLHLIDETEDHDWAHRCELKFAEADEKDIKNLQIRVVLDKKEDINQ